MLQIPEGRRCAGLHAWDLRQMLRLFSMLLVVRLIDLINAAGKLTKRRLRGYKHS